MVTLGIILICLDKIDHYVCVCKQGFGGTQCQINHDDCSKPGELVCRNNGFCIDLVGSYECKCIAGFTGRNCEYNVNECVSEPCQNSGTCYRAG